MSVVPRIPSKNIENYFETDFGKIRHDSELTFSVYLYFEKNDHIILWLRKGDSPSANQLTHDKNRGIQRIWVHTSEREAYEIYLRGPVTTEAPSSKQMLPDAPPEEPLNAKLQDPAPEQGVRDESPAHTPAPSNPTAQFMKKVLDSPDLSEAEKKEAISELAKKLLAPSEKPGPRQHLGPPTEDTPDVAIAKNAVQELMLNWIKGAKQKVPETLIELWERDALDPELDHGFNVATHAVLFALSFGTLDRSELMELANAGLLHDIGLAWLDRKTASLPWSAGEQSPEYLRHEALSVEQLSRPEFELTESLIDKVRGHHAQTASEDTDPLTELVRIADAWVSIQQGRYDGSPHSHAESLGILKGLGGRFDAGLLTRCTRMIENASEEMVQSARRIALGEM